MEFKKGDVVICTPGFDNGPDTSESSGGFGYEEGKVIKVMSVDVYTNSRFADKGAILWPDDDGGGIWSIAVEHYNPVEIRKRLIKEITL